jgi:hypothetical protein
MQRFYDNKEFFNQPVLTGDKNPYEIIKAYFEDKEMCEVRIRLWNLVETALTSDNIQFSEAAERLSLIHFYGQLEELVEATMKIAQELEEKLSSSLEIE